jgi:hypothetical protein
MMNGAEEQFLQSARQHGVSTLKGDTKSTNNAYASLVAALQELRSSSDKGVKFLHGLLSNSDPSVAIWAALFLLPFDERSATEALARVADSGVPRFAFDARVTLQEWRAGRLVVE